MTVNEMIDELKEQISADPSVGDRLIVLSCDSEGNRYSPPATRELNFFQGVYITMPLNKWYGDVYDPEELKSEIEGGFIEADAPQVPCLVIYPSN